MDTKHPPTTLITNVGNYKFQITAMTILICTRSKLCEKISLTQYGCDIVTVLPSKGCPLIQSSKETKMTSDKLFEDQKIQYLNCFQIV